MEKPEFENLEVYQLAEKIADEIWHIVLKWNELEKNTIGKQLICAADSIGAKIAEGRERYNFQDNRRFVRIARGSLNETIHFLRRASTRHLLTSENVNKLKLIIEDLSSQLNAYLIYLDNEIKQKPKNDD